MVDGSGDRAGEGRREGSSAGVEHSLAHKNLPGRRTDHSGRHLCVLHFASSVPVCPGPQL